MEVKEQPAKKDLIQNLTKIIQEHQDRYHNKEASISDEEFDASWDRLRALDPGNKIFKQIGKDGSSFFTKKKHVMPMGSLEKASDTKQFALWVQEHPSEFYVVEYKLDGASLELQYEDGKLVAAVTRGDGRIGDDILMNARKMKGVKRTLLDKLHCSIRGEVIMTHAVFSEHFSKEENAKANCRNAANGLMKRKDGVDVELLEFLCYDIWFDEDKQKYWEQKLGRDLSLEEEKMRTLKELGFLPAPHWKCNSEAEINELRESTIKKRESIAYDIDGLVIKLPSSNRMDMGSLLPDRQIAYKFPLQQVQTKLLDVLWSESGHNYTPIAILDPVSIAGTTVKRANIVNPNHIKELGLKLGSEVIVAKRGEIIPKVERVVFNAEGLADITFPKICRVCKSIVQNDGNSVFCPNLHCKKRLLFRVSRWISIHEIPNWGEALLNTLVLEKGMVQKLGDLYRLGVEDLMSLDRVAKPLAEKLHGALHQEKKTSLTRFLASLGIDGIALTSSETLIRIGTFNSIQDLFAAKVEDLSSVGSIGPILAKNIVETLSFLKEEIEDLLCVVEIEEVKQVQTEMSQKSFCFTGSLSISRKQAQSMVRKAGGMVKSSVVDGLDYLVSNESTMSTKMKEAQEKGVKVIDEQEFFRLVTEGTR